MKFILILLIGLTNSFADSVQLSSSDQAKLGDLIGRLPLEVRDRKVFKIEDRWLVRSVFPKGSSPFKVNCELTYYNSHDVASYADCELEIDPHHPETELSYDEFKIKIRDPVVTNALFQKISYGKPFRELRSNAKKKGLNFEGKESWIFSYYFKCSEIECVLRTLK